MWFVYSHVICIIGGFDIGCGRGLKRCEGGLVSILIMVLVVHPNIQQ